ncbi:Dbl homology domain-containing protein, partial [Mycena galericulata]
MQNDASAGSQLTERCAALHARLMTIRGFAYYDSLAPVDTLNRVRPVGHLWDVFSLGISLCYLFDLLPEEDGFNKINRSHFIPEHYDSANPEHGKKHAIALFAMQIRTDKVTQKIPGCEIFTVPDLWERSSTDGLLKVIATVAAIVNHLPPSAFEPNPAVNPSELKSVPFVPSGRTSSAPAHVSKAQETARKNYINEIVETERNYVKDLEAMHKYVEVLSESNLIDEDTKRRLFANIDEIFYFQRKFLIRLERTAGLEWQDQRWGQDFLEAEKEFSEVYAPYCANYSQASELVVTPDLQHNLASLNHLIDVKGELPGLIKKPVGRVCKYPLLVESLVKASLADNYQHYEELKDGLQAAKRVVDKINEAQCKAENEETVKSLRTRIDDWKGLSLDDFGEFLLDDTFVVTRSDVDREYHVFLFEKLMLLCKEVHPNKNVRTRNSRTTPLLIKGRIFVNNITRAMPGVDLDALRLFLSVFAYLNILPPVSIASKFPKKYTLVVWWKGEDSLQSFTLCSHRDYRMKQWESQIHQLIEEPAQHGGS